MVRLTAALQTMARRPPALALVQPGSVHDVVHVRSLLASTLPVIRARTASLREEIKAGNRLREQAETARASLLKGQEELREQRLALARLEERERARSRSLASSALSESDRALAFSEEARDLSALMGTRQYQARVRSSLAELPGPVLRPGTPAEPERGAPAATSSRSTGGSSPAPGRFPTPAFTPGGSPSRRTAAPTWSRRAPGASFMPAILEATAGS